ncbi:hypothetical protein LCGC14_0564920 [marine sediment metagenome]|uniref:Major capsid protein n=1 Tax=marine sediment metagenome TaxID=412755 RepID=A0A0F9RR30_9ZZZZ
MAVDTLTTSVSDSVRELLAPTVEVMGHDISAIWRKLVTTNRGVGMDMVGRDWKVKKVFRTGLAGAFGFEQLGAKAMLTDNTVTQFGVYGDNAITVFQGLDESTTPGYVQSTITLVQGKGIVHVPLTLKRAAALGAMIGEPLQAVIEGTANRVAQTRVNAFLAEDGSGLIGTFTVGGSDITINGDGDTVTLDSGQSAIQRFEDGQTIDLFRSSDDVKMNTGGPVFVGRVNPLGNDFQLFQFSGSTTLATTIQYDLVVRSAGRTSGSATASDLPTALSSLVVATGTLFGIDLDKYPKRRGYVVSNAGAAMDEPTLFKIAARNRHGSAHPDTIDTYVASEGVWAAYVENQDVLYTAERNGSLVNVNDGVNEAMFFNSYGRRYELLADNYITDGTIYGIKTRDQNFKIYVPPALPGAQSLGMFDGGVEFIGNLLGWSDIFGGAKATGGTSDDGKTTDMLEAPFLLPYQIAPDIWGGQKITNVLTAYSALQGL